jgi:Cft2 family RNA processing exonuclease
MDPETPGYKVAHAKRGEFVKLSELIEPIKVECTIEEFRFTAHSRLDGLLKIVERLKAKRVVLVHGDEAAIDRMGYEILKSFPKMKVHSAEIGKEIVISSQ